MASITKKHTISNPHQSEADVSAKKWLKRSSRKYITNYLAATCLRNGSGKLDKAYRNSFNCGNTIEVDADGHMRTYRCHTRWCLNCNALRTAKLITGYRPVIDSWSNPYFVTLTRPNCKGTEKALQREVTELLQKFRTINQSYYYRKHRPEMIRKLEVTYNAKADTFHPHFHLIVDNASTAQWLVDEWLKLCPTAVPEAQCIEACTPGAEMELFKYVTKLFSVDDDGKPKFIRGDKLDAIFCALRGRRTYAAYHCQAVSEDCTDADDVAQFVELANRILTYNRDILTWVATHSVEVDADGDDMIRELPEAEQKPVCDFDPSKNKVCADIKARLEKRKPAPELVATKYYRHRNGVSAADARKARLKRKSAIAVKRLRYAVEIVEAEANAGLLQSAIDMEVWRTGASASARTGVAAASSPQKSAPDIPPAQEVVRQLQILWDTAPTARHRHCAYID